MGAGKWSQDPAEMTEPGFRAVRDRVASAHVGGQLGDHRPQRSQVSVLPVAGCAHRASPGQDGRMTPGVQVERLRGRFWLMGAASIVVSGELTLGLDGPQLILDGMLTPSVKIVESATAPDGSTTCCAIPATGEDEPLTVHGRIEFGAAAGPVTLVGCLTTGRSMKISAVFNPLEGRQTLQALYAVCGDHIAGKDERFTALRVRLRHLDQWANLSGFTYMYESEQVSLTYEEPDVPPQPLPDGGFPDLEQVAIRMPTDVGGSLTRTVWLRAVQLRPTGWIDLDRTLVAPLSTLLTLATGADCPPVEVEVDNGSGSGWLSVHTSGWREPADRPLTAGTMLLPLAALGLPGVAAWLARVEALGPLPPVVAAAAAGQLGRIETSVLELATVAEGLARRLWPDVVRMSGDEATRARELAAAAFEQQPAELAEVVGAALGYLEELSYPQRLLQLAELVEGIAPGVLGRRTVEGRPSRWKALVCGARNEFAHRLQGVWLDDDRIDRYLTVTGSLRWLLTAVLLLETGLPAELLATQFGQHQPYLFFLRQAKEWQPQVYGPPGQSGVS